MFTFISAKSILHVWWWRLRCCCCCCCCCWYWRRRWWWILLLLLFLFFTPGSIGARVKYKKKIKSKRGMARGPYRRAEWMTRCTGPRLQQRLPCVAEQKRAIQYNMALSATSSEHHSQTSAPERSGDSSPGVGGSVCNEGAGQPNTSRWWTPGWNDTNSMALTPLREVVEVKS